MMFITTKRGDEGETDLLFGKRISKTHPRIEAIGSVDELSAQLGFVKLEARNDDLKELVEQIQTKLIHLMGELATLPADLDLYVQKQYGSVITEDIEFIESKTKEIESGGIQFKGWLKSGERNSYLAAYLHVCRTICRRAERQSWFLNSEGDYNNACLYLNRLSDLLWLLAAQIEKK